MCNRSLCLDWHTNLIIDHSSFAQSLLFVKPLLFFYCNVTRSPFYRDSQPPPLRVGLKLLLVGLVISRFFVLILFQKTDIPLSKRISSSLKSVIGSKTEVNAPTPHNMQNGIINMAASNDDLEMVHMTTKADKAVLDDGALQDSDNNEKMKKIANVIDNASRFLFPFVFICYNIFYWTYY